jgi:hypothetical protein
MSNAKPNKRHKGQKLVHDLSMRCLKLLFPKKLKGTINLEQQKTMATNMAIVPQIPKGGGAREVEPRAGIVGQHPRKDRILIAGGRPEVEWSRIKRKQARR